jgi:hypothetical protein
VQKIIASVLIDVSFRRALIENNLKNWHELVTRIASVQLVNQPDMFIWSLQKMESSLFNQCIE